MLDHPDQNPYAAPIAGGILRDGPAVPRRSSLAARSVVWAILAVAALPAAFLANIYVYAIRAAIHLGRWPRFNNPDPKSLPDDFSPTTAWLQYVGPILALAGAFALHCLLLRPIKRWPVRVGVACILVVGSWALGYGFLVLDPFGVIDWMMD